jgi:hypothetical protein
MYIVPTTPRHLGLFCAKNSTKIAKNAYIAKEKAM